MPIVWKRKGPSWDRSMPLLGLILLLLEVSPRPVFAWDASSFRVLAQFPLVGLAFLFAWEKRFLPALAVALSLAVLQVPPSVVAILGRLWSLEAVFPLLAWIVLLASYAHPGRRGVYFETAEPKESVP